MRAAFFRARRRLDLLKPRLRLRQRSCLLRALRRVQQFEMPGGLAQLLEVDGVRVEVKQQALDFVVGLLELQPRVCLRRRKGPVFDADLNLRSCLGLAGGQRHPVDDLVELASVLQRALQLLLRLLHALVAGILDLLEHRIQPSLVCRGFGAHTSCCEDGAALVTILSHHGLDIALREEHINAEFELRTRATDAFRDHAPSHASDFRWSPGDDAVW
mmetsp:Transcript_604/g.1403  ORF Transcript_604/g.1403 Transcript_604/m.1403 type:complete len:216 (-) Transcript_604:1976-2623(-)